MNGYEGMYYKLFNAATEAIDLIVHAKYGDAVILLGETQKECEAMFIDGGENES